MTIEQPLGPRERLFHSGAECLADADLVAILIGTGSRGEPVAVLAAKLMQRVTSLHALGRLTPAELGHLHGLGPAKASRITAAFELGRRAAARPLHPGRPITSSRDVDAALRPGLGAAERESFVAIPLDAKNRPMGHHTVAIGGLSSCPVTAADVFRPLIRCGASGVVLAHNHPSGEPTPSPEDVSLTDRLCRAGELVGIRVLDHLVIGREGYFSFLDAGLLFGTATATGT